MKKNEKERERKETDTFFLPPEGNSKWRMNDNRDQTYDSQRTEPVIHTGILVIGL